MKSLSIVLCSLMITTASHAAPLEIAGMGSGTYAVPIMSLKEARFKSTVRQQYDFSCGSAAVATLLTYQYGYPISEQTAFEEMYALGDQKKIQKEGFSLLDIKRFLAAHGFQADGFELPLEKLEETKIPAIALISNNGYNHFVVIKGIHDGRVLVGDPSVGTHTIPQRQFEKLWKNNLLFVIHNKQNRAGFNNKADWRFAPLAPMVAGVNAGVNRDGLLNITVPRLGPGDF
jgi:predicted double-glycine peptidase